MGMRTLGEFVAWIIGWDLVLEYAFGAATVASGWSGYLVGLLADIGITIPPQITTTPGTVLYQFHDRWQTLSALPAGVDASTLPHVTGLFNLVAVHRDRDCDDGLIIGIQGVGEPEYGDCDCEAGRLWEFFWCWGLVLF